jgi:hypothetical protein
MRKRGAPRNPKALWRKAGGPAARRIVRLGVRLGDDLRRAVAEQEAEEALGCLVEVSSEHQTFVEGGPGGTKDQGVRVHGHGEGALRLERAEVIGP